MRRTPKLPIVAVTGALLVAAGVTACGGSNKTPTANGSNDAGQAVRGGTLNMLGISDVDYMDPNISYYSLGYLAHRNWSRQLFSYPATAGEKDGRLAAEETLPDLATEMPTVANGGLSEDGLTYTIHIRSGPTWNTNPPRQVTAADEIRG